MDLPDTWPALEAMFFDGQDHLWISTITDDEKVNELWVLKTSGEMVTKFEWPKPIKAVKNGHLYTRETEFQEIIRYRIKMNKL